jgi:hypothetical protein
MATRAQLRSSLRALFGKWAGDRPSPLPNVPPGLPETVLPLVHDAVAALAHYQGISHARLFLHRLRRFIGRRDVDDAMLAAIVSRMAERMTYDDPVRLAQLTLDEAAMTRHAVRRHCRFRFDELIEPLPSPIAHPMLGALGRLDWTRRMMTRRYYAGSAVGRARLRVEAGLRHWRALGRGYERERIWVERWLHMIDRALARQPAAAPAIIETATLVRGYGDAYRQGLADWHLIIDGLAKPVFDGTLDLPDLAGAIATARRARAGDFAQTGLRQAIAAIRDDAAHHVS